MKKYEHYRDLVEVPDDKNEDRTTLELEIKGLLIDAKRLIDKNPKVKIVIDNLLDTQETINDFVVYFTLINVKNIFLKSFIFCFFQNLEIYLLLKNSGTF